MAQGRAASPELTGAQLSSDTIAAIATPPGSGALAVVRVSGPQARRAAALVLPGVELIERHAVVATARDREGALDQVVALFFPQAQSPTGEDLVELTCHGSPYIQKRLLAALFAAGARPARGGEFTQRAFLNGRLDLAQAEAVCDLIRAGTRLAHRAALAQLQGGLSRQVERLRRPVLDLLVHLEALLDHPEEDIKPLPAEVCRTDLAGLREPIERLADTFRTGRILRDGARVCLIGRTNAGKSSLLNALLGCSRAIVSAEPGTTRDTIEEPCDLAGLLAVLVDTAGLGHASRCGADDEGARRAQSALAASDLALLVVDGSRPLGPEDEAAHGRVLADSAAEGRPVITVFNKADLPLRAAGPAACSVSSLRGTGLDELKRLAAQRLGQDSGLPAAGEAVVAGLRHHQALRRAAAQMRQAERAVDRHPGAWEELAARHLRDALAALDEITGPAAPDELLSDIFSRFCVGK